MLKQHEFYVYHDGMNVMARMGVNSPIVAEICDTAQKAHDKVQAIVNPSGRTPDSFAEVNAKGQKLGFLSKEYQDAISTNCEAYVKAAYAAV